MYKHEHAVNITARKEKRVVKRYRNELQVAIKNFFAAAVDKSEEEIKSLYATHEARWCDYAHRVNAGGKKIVLTDAFESSILKGLSNLAQSKATLKPLVYAEYVRVLKACKPKTFLQRFLSHFFQKS